MTLIMKWLVENAEKKDLTLERREVHMVQEKYLERDVQMQEKREVHMVQELELERDAQMPAKREAHTKSEEKVKNKLIKLRFFVY
jgi:hypothetical protein